MEPDDIADIRRRFKNADKQSRLWWVVQIVNGPYGVTYHPKTIAAQLKARGVPPAATK